MEEENRKILQFAQQQQEREAERMAVKQQREDAMSAVQEKVPAFYFKLLFLFAADTCGVFGKANKARVSLFKVETIISLEIWDVLDVVSGIVKHSVASFYMSLSLTNYLIHNCILWFCLIANYVSSIYVNRTK